MEQKNTAIDKAVRILLAFCPNHPTWGVRELAAHLGFSAATVQRILKTLMAYHLVEQNPANRQYRLGSAFYRFIQTLQTAYPITRTAPAFMEQLAEQTGETVHLNVVEKDTRVCIQTVESRQALKASMPVGSRSPLYAGASSKCLLAFSQRQFIERYLADARLEALTDNTITDPGVLRRELEVIRRQGYAVSLAERNPGLGSISVPIFNHQGTLTAALSLAIPEIRFTDPVHRAHCLQAVRKTALAISQAMGFNDPDTV